MHRGSAAVSEMQEHRQGSKGLAWYLALTLAAGSLSVRNAAGQAQMVSPSNPKVGIRLEAATCAEAVAALEKATGVPLALETRSLRPEQQSEVDRRLAQRARFDWTTAQLGAALRQIAERFALSFHIRPGGQFVFSPAAEPESSQPVHPAGQVDVGGYRIGIAQTTLHRVLTDRLTENDLNVGLQVEPLNGDVEAIAGVRNFSAVDDRGTVLRTRDAEIHWTASVAPDRWTHYLGLPAPNPPAKRLVSVRGELFTYRKISRHRAEFELPLRVGGRKWRENGIELEVLGFNPSDTTARITSRDTRAGASVTARLNLSHEFDAELTAGRAFSAPFSASFQRPAPLLIGVSGASYAPQGTFSGVDSAPTKPGETPTTRWMFSAIDEPIRKIVFSFLRKERPEHTLTFSLKDIPLPQPDTARPTREPWFNPSKLEAGHPFFRSGGAALVSPVQVAGRPAPTGRLFLGLAPCRPQTVPGSEWIEAPIGTGTAPRFPNVAPGTYRVLRLFYPRDPAGLPPQGIWRNSEVIVEVPERGEVMLPLLTWNANAAPTPREIKDRAHPVLPQMVREDDDGRVELRTTEVTFQQQASLRFLREPHLKVYSTSTVTVGGGTGRNHSNRLWGLRNCVACDDRGNLYSASGGGVMQSNRLWHGRFGISGLAPQVERLAWIEGDLLAWSRVEPVRIEIPIPKVRQTVKRTVEGVSLEVTLTPGEGDDELKKPEANRPRRGLRINGRIQAPPTVQLEGPRQENSIAPEQISATGTAYPLANSMGGIERGGKGTICTFEGEFPALDEPLAQVRFEFVVKSELRKVAAIRAGDILIPREKPAAAPAAEIKVRPAPGIESRTVGAGAPSPYSDPRGGNLVQQVRIAGRPASEGTLSFGLLREVPGGLQAVRWVEARVDAEGAARVDGLKPGVYRVQCKYRAADGSQVTGKGRWHNNQSRIRIHPGKATLLPALEWKPG